MTLPRWIPIAVGLCLPAAAGVVLGWSLKRTPPPIFRTVIVKDSSIGARVPHVTPTLGERITKTTVRPIQIAVSEGKPGVATVTSYCGARVRAPTPTDTAARAARPPQLPPFSGRFADSQLELQATRSDGSLWAATFHVQPPLEWVAGHGGASDTMAIVRENRALFRLLFRVPKCLKGGLAGGAIGVGAGLLAGLPVGRAAAIGAGAGCAGSQF